MSEEKVVNPSHYNQGIQVWDFIISHNMNFLEGNIIKYIARYKHKNGLEDLKKARFYLEKLIDVVENEQLCEDDVQEQEFKIEIDGIPNCEYEEFYVVSRVIDSEKMYITSGEGVRKYMLSVNVTNIESDAIKFRDMLMCETYLRDKLIYNCDGWKFEKIRQIKVGGKNDSKQG